jgi:hypothetical protein
MFSLKECMEPELISSEEVNNKLEHLYRCGSPRDSGAEWTRDRVIYKAVESG